MSVGPNQRLTSEERGDLVAFLDGELPESLSRALNAKLTNSPTARREAELLKKTWDALDELPRPQVTDQFQDRTLSYVRTVQAREAERFVPLRRSLGAMIRIAACLAAVILGAATGYWALKMLGSDPDDHLIRNIGIAEHLDEYLEVGDYDFLEKLAQTPEFGANTRVSSP